MAIKIPSRNIYEKDNDKIRDNKIDRIEVGAFEILPNNEYETPVYNEKITNPTVIEETEYALTNEKYKYLEEDSAAEYEDYIGVYAGITAKYTNIDINIPKLLGKGLISDLIINKDNENKIGVSLTCEIRYYSVSADYYTATGNISNKERTENEAKREIKKGINIQNVFSKENGEKGYLYHSKTEKKYGVSGGSVSVETKIKDTNNILSTTYKDEPESYKIEGLKILSGATSLGLSGHSGDYDYIYLTGEEIDYTPVSIEITIYGNTIGIDLQDKTVYIPNESGNKPFSVEGNELIQVSNYTKAPTSEIITTTGISSSRLDFTASANDQLMPSQITILFWNNDIIGNNIKVELNDGVETPEIYEFDSVGREITIFREPYQLDFEKTIITVSYPKRMEMDMIQYNFSKTQAHYAKGKETATIRCSISDYYDEKGEKVIATNNSNKMAFDIYDEVIPYSYGADGNDKPLSRHKDGSPKTFVVLGTRIFYDGAVWQELTLQEK